MLSMGYKGNMFDIQASLLLPQIPKLKGNLEKRQEISKRYMSAFGPIDGIDLPGILPRTRHAHNLFTIWVNPDRRDEVINKIQEEGVGVAVNYRPVHLLTYYRKIFSFSEGLFPVAEMIGKRTISMPLYPMMSEDAIAQVIEAVKNVLKIKPTLYI